ncbi:hypothetical protein OG500_11250 [Kitasatospora sp. NBC_01250]|uniref:hypothetical protein n=1 Tax=unclassified Kitasatospora TaxID=2633591 RepID=UPI002E104911|nr:MULTISPECIES: hypothetical protein [unclassified Kitasatospora]WSJ66729.1 hypothetical protein OG294_11660 [Kitasatospora sp. NBC_01302]
MDDKHLFVSVCEVLSLHGFELAPPRAAGLSVRLRPGAGLVLGWRPGEDLIGPTLHACPHPADAAGRTEFRGIRGALMLALSEVLDAAGFTVTTLGADLLVTANPLDPGATPAIAATPTCPAPRRSRPARPAVGVAELAS